MLLHGGANNLISLVIRALSEYVKPTARPPTLARRDKLPT